MVDVDTRALSLGAVPIPDVPDMQFPIVPGENVLWLEPRRYGPKGPVWDSTDEIYITYNEEGERALVTTGPDDIFNEEHSYQRTGSARYFKLADLAGDVGRSFGDVGRRVGGATRSLRAGSDRQPETLDAPGGRHRAGDRPGGGANGNPAGGGESAAGAERDAWDLVGRSGVSERPGRIRSHRHCPGCRGHHEAFAGGWELAIRAGLSWILGYTAIYFAGLGIDLAQYLVLTGLLPVAVLLFRPVWREYVVDQARRQARRERRNGG